ncbi:hypothetical protein KJZ71_02975 [Patescibacteria group bacterium]|uniref:Uncharacterized protein n=1 Tax=candidate division WWE3 bacterium TaxID=2053526 RepID=A0A928Y4S4_UNCKA|nr:hypothetical protein [candidate division WWE3 bacterium]MCL4732741.1 hypothetical protein [Patescibacteria group bacterium]MDL1953348.1 hypothetical protein [Candidatus Uhrbacteria bacterium UHB]RIL00718.1 MAG: hypothetical protein DCC77_04230 [Candidatus Uhrbacteria bacterium]
MTRCVDDEQYGKLRRRTDELIRRVAEGTLDYRNIMDHLQALIEGRVEVREPAQKGSETVYRITIDRSQTLADMIAAGKYGYVNENITETYFPLKKSDGKREVEVVLVHLDERLTTDQVKAELDRRGLKPASIVELLFLGAAHPDLQREFPVVALGSSWRLPNGDLSVPELWYARGKRHLSLSYDDPDSMWLEHYRFVALRK